MAHDIFISHSSKDKLIADGICANLEAAGLRCWIAPRDIVPGEDWPTAILTAISKSKVMVIIFSGNSNNSEDVGREIALAANHNLIIVPFKIEDVEPEPVKKFYLATTNWLEAMNPPTRKQIQSLVQTVAALIPPREESGIVQPGEELAEPEPSPQKKTSFWSWVWVPLLLLLVSLVVLFWPRMQAVFAPPAATATTAPTLMATQPLQPSPTTTSISISRTLAKPTYLSLYKTLESHTGEVRSLDFTGNMHGEVKIFLISGSSDNTIIVWNASNWTPLHTSTLHNSALNSLFVFPEKDGMFASASNDFRILILNYYDDGFTDIEKILTGHSGAVTTVEFSSDGRYLASGSTDTTIKLWDFQLYNQGNIGGELIRTIYDHPSFVNCLTFSPDSKTLASGGYLDNTIMLHDPATGARLGTLYGNAGDILSLEFSPDGKILASASENETITLWDTSSWTKLRSFSPGSVVIFSKNGQTLISGSKDGRIILWDVESGDQLQTLDAHSDRVTSFEFLYRGEGRTDKLASGSADGTIKIWDFEKR